MIKKIRGGIIAPKGFKQSVINAGIKKKKPDMALVVSDTPATCEGVFTTNRFKAASVLVCQSHIRSQKHKAVVINSGNANCLTGKKGIQDALSMTSGTAVLLKCKTPEVLVCSTGIIGKRLPIAKIKSALPELVNSLSGKNSGTAAKAIMTTDKFPKEVSYSIALGSKQIKIAGIAKGAGMIQPNMATMLCVITTDAIIKKSSLKAALKQAVAGSFNSITIDGDMSTNDTVLIMANGLSGVDVCASKPAYNKFIMALDTACLELAKMIVRDGEGATKFIQIDVTNAKTDALAKAVALSIANSNLFKTMCYGKDPNFGRVAAACGALSQKIDPLKVDIYLNGKIAVKSGVATQVKFEKNIFAGKDIFIKVALNSGNKSARIYTSDLTPEYIKINAAYS